jgi:ubiquinone/menaquinone biosynthesis C-methylase UbiE
MNDDKPYPNVAFRGMAVWLRLREIFGDRRQRLVEAGVKEGQTILDYGCGIGSYAIPAAQIVGTEGRVYALDMHPLAIETVQRRARKENLPNVKTIHSDLDTGLADQTVDVVLLYDVFHMVPDQPALLRELHRVLKPGGRLSVLPDHMANDELLSAMNRGNLFGLQVEHGAVLEFKSMQEI